MRGRKDRPPRRWKKVERFDVRNQKKVWRALQKKGEKAVGQVE